MKAYVEAYGCTLNIGESREVEDLLLSSGWELVDSPGDADMAVLATCVVVAKTERAMLKRVHALSSARRLVITGCMATACREAAERAAPGAEFVPPGDVELFRRLVDRVGPGAVRPASSGFAIVPLATGCMGECAYCITRLARGGLRSRPAEAVLRAVASAVRTGPREVRLTAQDTACYGHDIGADLPSLVSGICALPGDFRLRVGMMNPKSAVPIAGRLAGMYLEPKVFKFLHLPVQSGSDRVLTTMRRGYCVRDFLQVIDTVRSEVPDVSLSTDIIVGYPGETEEDHEASLDLIRRTMPDIVNVTKFSPRPGTEAARARDRVDGNTVKDRSREITEVRFDAALRVNKSWTGRELRVLATEPGKSGTTLLRTDEYRQVVVRGSLELGRYYDIIVEDATPTYLLGRRA